MWFAFKLVSLQSHIHYIATFKKYCPVVICFQISIFAESHTLFWGSTFGEGSLWFAFKLVSLQSHIHFYYSSVHNCIVVICFQISIFAESHTLNSTTKLCKIMLWFAFKLVSLQSHIHSREKREESIPGCDLLSN